MGVLTKLCLICKGTISKSPSESRSAWDTRRKYCSRGCTNEAKRGVPQTAESNEKRRQWSTGRKHTLESKAKFSGANASSWKGGKSKCLDCDNRVANFYAIRCRSCHLKWSVGENASHWQGGKTAEGTRIRNSQTYQEWRTAVFERDNYECQMCGQRGGNLHADHIKPFAQFPELRLDISNGRTLCVPCHKQTDTYLVRARWGNKEVVRTLFALS